MDKAFHAYFMGIGKIFYELLKVLKFITTLHTFSNTLLLLFCSGISDFNYIEKNHMERKLYCNHCDTFLDFPKIIRGKLV